MRHIDFEPCLTDPDVWMRPATKANGLDYYEYVLLYTDDALCISENPESILRNKIGKYFELKEESIGPPKQYLGGHVRKVTTEDGTKAWSFSSAQYVKSAVNNVVSTLEKKGETLPRRSDTPLSSGYRPELDVSPELGHKEMSYY